MFTLRLVCHVMLLLLRVAVNVTAHYYHSLL